MCDRSWGRIITVASDAGLIGMPIGVSAYGAAKGAAISLMRHVAIELAACGVTANSISLGLMEVQDPPPARLALAENIPLGRMGTPADVGALCVYLASEEAAWMTGQTIHLNGGEVTS
jgi:NAD(P)-dependent dehydrogenase (short-subunit alcohol dehydrogenase family)